MAITDTILNAGKGYGNALSSIQNLSSATSGYANIIKSFTRSKEEGIPSRIRDFYTNGFLPDVKNGSAFVPNFFARAFDEPTYLTFRIEFMFENDFRNYVYDNNDLFFTSLKTTQADAMYDNLPEPFLEDYSPARTKTARLIDVVEEDEDADPIEVDMGDGIIDYEYPTKKIGELVHPEDGDLASDYNHRYRNLMNMRSDPTKDPNYENKISSSRYSTEWYLRHSIGDRRRANMLKTFKLALKDIERVFPFYFRSISGLKSLTDVDSARGTRLKDSVITIDCLEALDLRITQLLNLYRKIVWDDVYQRWALPDMMRFFGMKIYVSEIRMFHDWKKASGKRIKASDYIGTRLEKMNDSHYSEDGNKLNNALNGIQGWATRASAISNSYLGTKSNITKAIDLASSTYGTAMSVYNNVMDIINDMYACDNAINAVMPTICYECHMCEFDISETMGHIDSLDSWNSRKEISPKIKIKVGQVKEYQDYPLNRYLKMDEGKGVYKYSGNTLDADGNNVDRGTHISDNLLAKRRKDLTDSRNNYADGDDNVTDIKANYKKYSDAINKNSKNKSLKDNPLNYRPELVTAYDGAMSLTASLLNEGVEVGRRFTKNSAEGAAWLGSYSTATTPYGWLEKTEQNRIDSVKQQLDLATERAMESSGFYIKIEDFAKNFTPKNDKVLTDDEIKAFIEEYKNAIIYGLSNKSGAGFNDNTKRINNFVEQFDSEISDVQSNILNENKVDSFKRSIDEYSDEMISKATSPDDHEINKMDAIKEMLDAAVEKIYNGSEIQSMSVDDKTKARIADDMFEKFIENIESSRATENEELKRIIQAYRTITSNEKKEDDYYNSPATETKMPDSYVKEFSSVFERIN